MNHDDEDWLYRRGRYSDQPFSLDDDGPAPAAVRTPAQPSASVTPRPTPRPSDAAPPVRPTQASKAPERPPSGPRRRPPVVRVLLGLVALFVAYLVAVPLLAVGQIARTDAVPAGERPPVHPGHLFVLAGSDQREQLTAQEQQKLGTGNDPGQRSDVLMLLYVPPSGKAALISVPRDSYVPIPGHGKAKINAAYSMGGPKLLVETVEKATGLRVDGYAEIGFAGFVRVVDAVGGVQMCPKAAINDKDSNLNIQAGCQNFDGVTALGYARMRHEDPLGDLGRVQRQRELLSAIAKKVVAPQTVLMPWRYWGVLTASAQAVSMGRDDGWDDLAALALGVVKMGTGDGITLTVPVSDPNLRTPSGLAVAWNATAAGELFSSIGKGDTANLLKFAK